MPPKMPIVVRTILEMLGAPKEYIEKTLKDYVQKLKTEKLKILKEHFEPAEQKEKLFSTFAELDIEFADVNALLDFCFDSLPSSIDIISPDSFTIEAGEFTDFLNDLQARLHQADMMIKTYRAQQSTLDRNATHIFQNFILQMLRQSPKTSAELAPLIGVQEKDIAPFLKQLMEKNKIVQKEDRYICT